MRMLQSLLFIMLAVLMMSAVADAQFIRVRDDVVIDHADRTHTLMKATQAGITNIGSRSGGRLTVEAVAWHNQPVSTGGTLYPLAFMNPALINGSGRIAFMAKVSGAAKNQGIFVADTTGLYPIAMGCGGGGGSGDPGTGSGDPSPMGGTFTGFFGGTMYAPSINAAGDVLFLCDVYQGSSHRALFLYRAATSDIVKIAAAGDPSPLGGNFGEVGPGAVNDHQQVVFLAQQGTVLEANYFLWQGGTVSKIAAKGDPAPGGGTFTILGSEWLGFADGTQIPSGPVPAINSLGHIAFRALVSGGVAERGLFLSIGGTHQWYVKRGEATPLGGTFLSFWGPHLNDKDEMAFLGDITGGSSSSAWIAGTPGNWRKALAFYDDVDGGQCWGMAVSRSPMTPLDNEGNLIMWANAKMPNNDEVEYLLVSAPDGHQRIVAREGDATPVGGSYGTMQSWPSMNHNAQCALSCATPGASGGKLNTHFLASDILTWKKMGFALSGTSGEPVLEGQGALEAGTSGGLNLTNARPNAGAYLFVGFSEGNYPFYGGTLVPSIDIAPLYFTTNGSGAVTLPWASWVPGIPPDFDIYFHFWIVDPAGPAGAAASNALKAQTQ